MNENDAHYFLAGDITTQDAKEIQRLLDSIQCPIQVSLSDRRPGGFAYTTPELLTTAAAVAGVLGFIWDVARNRAEASEKDSAAIKDLNERFKKSDVVGLQVEEIRWDKKNIVVVIHDVPQGRIIEIDCENDKCSVRSSKRKRKK